MLVLAALFAGTMLPTARGDQYVVDTEADSLSTGCSNLVIGDCSLRGAIERANLNPGFDTITFGFGADTFVLSLVGSDEDLNQTGDLDLLEEAGILGNGVVIIDASLVGDRALDLLVGNDEVTLLEGLTVTGGQAPTGDIFFTGGGIRCVDSQLFLNDVTVIGNGPVRNGGGVGAELCDLTLNFTSIDGNTATNGGGGIHLSGSTLSAPVSAFLNNQADHGGGLSVGIVSSATIDNTTFSGNTAVDGSAIQNSGTLDLDFVTIVSPEPAAASAIAHLNNNATTTFGNSLIVGTCATLPSTVIATNGGNLEVPGDSCHLDPLTDQINVADALLEPLAFHGGRTLSHMPAANSPAVDDPLTTITNCPGYDQRFGPPRPLDGNNDGVAACDIGAIERDALFADGFESGNLDGWSTSSG